MSIYAISDLHLSYNTDKPMDIFGWKNYENKIKENWNSKVKESDLVILGGDFSWSMDLKDTYKDFEFIHKLPGKKILIKGNHDYWWGTLTKMKKYINEIGFNDINFLYNNSYEFEGKIICGTRGWNFTDLQEDDEKIYNREIQRLKLSLEDAVKKYGTDKEIIVCLHYPPLKTNEISDFVRVMEEYNVTKCIYGHLHGPAHKFIVEKNIDNIQYIMTSCDYTNFDLVKLF
ncbi:MAG: metallophosphoesterase [Clostridia bacterium]|jgi:predicted phoshohydrolase|nr:metallophosphoesterase [Clostridium sp.]MEE0126966.1 metallophosphoesterase [Clostridia bacterium]